MRLLPFFLAIFITGCGENVLQAREKPKELLILTRGESTTCQANEAIGVAGFDCDLTRLFVKKLGLKSRVVAANSDADIVQRLKQGEGQMAAAWLTPVDDPEIRSSTPYFQSHNLLITHEASLPLTRIDQLAYKTIHVVAGSRQEAAIRELHEKVPTIFVDATEKQTALDLMESVSSQRYEAALVNDAEFDIGSNFYPDLQGSLVIGSTKPIVWLFAPDLAPDLIAKANAFLDELQKSGEMERLNDRYFGHIDRLTQADSVRFIERTRTILPQYRSLFHAAQVTTGIDWRVLAALAYQESQWTPQATSPTGVRGMMMLTGDTADRLGVNNRLDPSQSIRAGAQYLNNLRDELPTTIDEPDRLWMALAAYNLGMGHMNAARYIAKVEKANPDTWYEMKRVLPLLAQARYYNRLKSGKGRGGEAVIMVENIRVYTDILNRYEQPYHPLEFTAEPIGGKSSPSYFPLQNLSP